MYFDIERIVWLLFAQFFFNAVDAFVDFLRYRQAGFQAVGNAGHAVEENIQQRRGRVARDEIMQKKRLEVDDGIDDAPLIGIKADLVRLRVADKKNIPGVEVVGIISDDVCSAAFAHDGQFQRGMNVQGIDVRLGDDVVI